MNVYLPMERRDRPWVDSFVTIVCGPFDMPSVCELHTAVEQVAEQYPSSRMRWGFNATRDRWLQERPLESIVVERAQLDSSGFAATIDGIARDTSLDPPLTLVKYPNHLGMKMSHSLGDGLIFVSVIAAVMLSAVNGVPLPWPTIGGGRAPLVRAALRTFGRHPSLLMAAVRDRYVADDAAKEEVRVTGWESSRRTVYTAVPADLTSAVYKWAADKMPGASRFGVQAALYMRALHQVGLKVSSDTRVMVDLRGYIGSRLIDGNFFAGVPVRLTPNMTAEEVTVTVRRTKSSGRPLVNQLITAARVGKPGPHHTMVNTSALPQLTLSYLGAPTQVDTLPYQSAQPPVYAASVEPGGPLGLTFVHGHCAGQMILNSCFHDNVVDAELVRKAHDAMTTDPIGLLTGSVRA